MTLAQNAAVMRSRYLSILTEVGEASHFNVPNARNGRISMDLLRIPNLRIPEIVGVVGMKVRYIGDYFKVAFDKQKTYEVISIEKGWFRIMTELGEDYLFPPECFEIVEE